MNPSPSPRPRILEMIRESAAAGMLTTDIARALKRDHDNTAAHMTHLLNAKQVAWWPDPVGKCTTRRRWYLPELRPARCPKPTGAPVGMLRDIQQQTAGLVWRTPVKGADGVTRLAPITHDARYQVAPGAKVYGAGFAAAGIGRYLDEVAG